MKTPTAIALTLMTSFVLAACASGSPTRATLEAPQDRRLFAPAVAAQAVQEDHYPSVPVQFSNGAKGLSTLTYSTPKGYRPLRLDLYFPPEDGRRPKQGFPWIVYIHGGGWMAGDRRSGGIFENFPEVLATIAARGYVVAAIDYRLSGEILFPGQIQDVKTAIRWLRARANQYGLDPNRAVVWGGSAGGHLAALAALSCHAKELAPTPASNGFAVDSVEAKTSDCVQGAVAWYGIFNMETMAQQRRGLSQDAAEAPEWRLLGCSSTKCKKAQLRTSSPIHYADGDDPPLLLIVGDRDNIVPHQQTLEMAKRANDVGMLHELVVIPGVDHGFTGNTLDVSRDSNRKALARTLDFFGRAIGPNANLRKPTSNR